MSNTRQHLIGLDGFRGVAAILVAVLHISQEGKIEILQNNFNMAVDFFFLLSGFVIGISYESKLIDRRVTFSEFVKVRIIRLYPMIFIAALMGIAARVLEARFSLGSIALSGIAALLILPLPRIGDSAGNSYPINGPSWSLTYELLVNFIFAAAVRLMRGGGLWVAFIVSAAVEISAGIHLGRLDFATIWGDQILAIVRTLPPFLLGVILYRVTAHWRPAPSDIIPLVGAIVLLILLLAPVRNVYYTIVCIYVFFPCLIVAGSVQPRSRPLTSFLRVLGEISYPLYAINQPVARSFAVVSRRAAFVGNAINPTIELALLVLLLSGIALAVSRIYELPVRAALRRVTAPTR